MKFREACLKLKNSGFYLDRVKGSHHIFIKNGFEIVVPKHSRDLPHFVIRNINKAIQLMKGVICENKATEVTSEETESY